MQKIYWYIFKNLDELSLATADLSFDRTLAAQREINRLVTFYMLQTKLITFHHSRADQKFLMINCYFFLERLLYLISGIVFNHFTPRKRENVKRGNREWRKSEKTVLTNNPKGSKIPREIRIFQPSLNILEQKWSYLLSLQDVPDTSYHVIPLHIRPKNGLLLSYLNWRGLISSTVQMHLPAILGRLSIR